MDTVRNLDWATSTCTLSFNTFGRSLRNKLKANGPAEKIIFLMKCVLTFMHISVAGWNWLFLNSLFFSKFIHFQLDWD